MAESARNADGALRGVPAGRGSAQRSAREGKAFPLKIYTYGSFLKPLDCRRAEEFSPFFPYTNPSKYGILTLRIVSVCMIKGYFIWI